MVLNRVSKKEADARLAGLRRQVFLQVFTLRYEDGVCRETRQAAEELAEATSRLSVEVNDCLECGDLLRKHQVDEPPALIASAKDAPELRVFGVPTGFVLPSLLDALVALGNPVEPKADLVAACALEDPRAALASVRLDLVACRRDHSTHDAAAALWRAAFACRVPGGPRVVASLRIADDLPRWAALAGPPPYPVLLVDEEVAARWPFTDADVAAAARETAARRAAADGRRPE